MTQPRIVDMDEETIVSNDSSLVCSCILATVPTREERRSSFITATRSNIHGPQQHSRWPAGSRYFDPLIMDGQSIADLLMNDTLYERPEFSWCLDYTYVSDNTPYHRDTQASDRHEAGIFSPEVLNSCLTVIHIRQRRLYAKGDTTTVLSVDATMWINLLQNFEILPSFIELLHDNNGSTLAHTSFELLADSENRPESSEMNERSPEAFHVGYKMGSAMDEEAAIYARYSYKSKKTLILVLGTDAVVDQTRAFHMLEAKPRASLFHLVFAFQSTTLAAFEQIRWRLDYMTLDFEAETGFTTLERPGTLPQQTLEQFDWNRDKIVAAWEPRFMKWAAARVNANFKALLRHMSMYEELSKHQPSGRLNVVELDNLRSAVQTKAELAQSQHDQTLELQSRLENQMDAIRTLKAQRDTDLNIEIAKATKRDGEINVQIAEAVQHESESMRRIAVITVLFLPGTFVATFFSMVFFQVDTVRPASQLWWYPTVAVPLTLGITVLYSARFRKALCRFFIGFFQAAIHFRRPENYRQDDREKNSVMLRQQDTQLK